MRQVCLFIFLACINVLALANPVDSVVSNNGNWKTSSTWSLNRVPANGDTVIIPAGEVVIIDNNQNLSGAALYIKIYGTLQLSKDKLLLGANSTIAVFMGGSILGTGNSSEMIGINGVTKFSEHNDVSVFGPAYANQATGTSPNGFNLGGVPLPVNFIGFSATLQNNNVIIQWATAQEMNSSYYKVQRSVNGDDWNTIANVKAAGNSVVTQTYSYTDKNISANLLYYRVCQVDIDGNFILTPVRMIRNDSGNTEISVIATSDDLIYLHFPVQLKTQVTIRLITMSGQIISQKTLNEPIGQVIMPVQNAMKGIYIVSVSDGQTLKYSKKIVL